VGVNPGSENILKITQDGLGPVEAKIAMLERGNTAEGMPDARF